MFVPEDIRKSVVFIGYKMANGEMRLAGSAFFVGGVNEKGAYSSFLVTARHVIDGIRNLGFSEVFIRANTADGESIWIPCPSSDWLFHPSGKSADIAFLTAGVPNGYDHLVVPVSMCVTDDVLEKHAVSVGDEVFIVGLFRHHHGTKRNIPIVRVGNLAAMAEEQVATKAFGLMDAYLIEARSIGGLSGSPVFLNLGVVRYIDNQVKHAQGGPICLLLGLIHGHFDSTISSIDSHEQDANNPLSVERVNTGIAIVVPMHKIREAIDARLQAKD